MGMNFNDMQTKGIMTALLTGDKSWLSEDTVTAFRSSGAAHILALSGFHLGIIYALISRTLSILGNSRSSKLIRSILIILLCGIYTSATGAGPSISRAFLFILIGEIALLSGRYRNTSTIMMSSMLIQLLFSPGSAQSIGFQLSYAAMAGIVFVFPWLKGLWPEEIHDQGTRSFGEKLIEKPARWIWNSAAMSISCQLTTGPLVHIYFGAIPKHFLLTNLLALPLVGILIPSAVLTAFLSALGWCPSIMTHATEALAGLLTRALEVISTM
jgi:competence protein ComEC